MVRRIVPTDEGIEPLGTSNRLAAALLYHTLKSSMTFELLGRIIEVNILSKRSLRANMPRIANILLLVAVFYWV